MYRSIASNFDFRKICSSLMLLTCVMTAVSTQALTDPDDSERRQKKSRSLSPHPRARDTKKVRTAQECDEMEVEPMFPVTGATSACHSVQANDEEQPNEKKAHIVQLPWRLPTPFDNVEMDPSLANGIDPSAQGLLSLSHHLLGVIASYPGVAQALGNGTCKFLQTFVCENADRFSVFCRLKSEDDLHKLLKQRAQNQVIDNSNYLSNSLWQHPVIFTLYMPGLWFDAKIFQLLKMVADIREVEIKIISTETHISTIDRMSLPFDIMYYEECSDSQVPCVILRPLVDGFRNLRSLLLWTECDGQFDWALNNSFDSPDDLSNLTNLEHLRVIQGSNPFSPYKNLTKLKTLELVKILPYRGCRSFKGMDTFYHPVDTLPVCGLNELVLGFQKMSYDYPCNSYHFSNLDFLSSANALEKLMIVNRRVMDIKVLAKLKKLRELTLNDSRNEDNAINGLDLSPLEGLPLAYLELMGIIPKSYRPVLTLVRLKSLSLDRWATSVFLPGYGPDQKTQFQPSEDTQDCIDRLSTLHTIALCFNWPRDRLFRVPKHLTQLRRLIIRSYYLISIEQEIQAFKETHPQMEISVVIKNTHQYTTLSPTPPPRSKYPPR